MSLLIGRFYRFGEFTLDADQRVLLYKGKPLPLAPKVFDTLLILVERSGRIVEKEELMNRLWPDTFVEEANLTFNIQQLRKSLRDNARKPAYIETIARRGYRFIATVEEILRDESKREDSRAEDSQTSNAHLRQPVDEIETYEPRPAARSNGADTRVIREKQLGESTADPADSTRASKRTAALVGVLAILLASLGLLIWRFSNDSPSSPNDNKRVPAKYSLASAIKIERLTLTGQSRLVAISSDGKYIAYTRAIDRRAAIWVRQLATNTNVEIAPAIGLIYGLGFAHNGEYLYFVRGDPTALFRVSLLGGVPTRIVENVEAGFSVSDDDSQVVFVRRAVDRDGHRTFSLVIASLDGAGERTLLSRSYPDKLDAPVWAPDNQSILCAYGSSEGGSQGMSIAEVKLSDGSVRDLSTDRFFNIGKMARSYQNRALIIAARKNAQDNKELWLVSYPSMEISQITDGLSPYVDLSIASSVDKAVASQATRISGLWVGSSRQPRDLRRITQAIDEFCWTPNGRLLYQSTASGSRDLWITQPDGADQKQLTNDPAVDGTPAVTPDNRYIVFTSNRTGALQLWRMNMDGSNQIQLTDGASKNYPAISTDGKWVLYNTTNDWRLWKVPIEGGESVRLTQYPASFPSVSPDGKTVACLARTEPRRELSIVVVSIEGGQPLKRIDVDGAGFSNDRIQWTSDGAYLLYAAERDGPTFIVKQPVNGGPGEEVLSFDTGVMFDFGYSFDGQLFAVTRGEWQHDIVLIDGLNRN